MTVHEGRVPVASVAGRPDMVITASMPRRPASLMVRLRSSPWVISGSGCNGLQASDDAVGSPILTEGRVDFEFTARRPDNPDVHWQHLLSQPLALSVPAGHRLADRDEVSNTEAAEEFVMLRPTWILRALPEKLCASAGFTPRVSFEGDDLPVVRGFVEAGLGVAVVPVPTLNVRPTDSAE